MTFVVVLVTTAVLFTVWLRSRTPSYLQWIMGWLLMLCHQGLEQVAPWGGTIAATASGCCLGFAILVFVVCLGREVVSERFKVSLGWPVAATMLLYTVGQYSLPSGIQPSAWQLANVLACSAGAGVWAIKYTRLHKAFTLPLIMTATAVSAWAVQNQRFDVPPKLAMSVGLYLVAALIQKQYRRASPGVVLSATGFLLWSLLYPVSAVAAHSPDAISFLTRAGYVFIIMASVGTLIVQLEEDAQSTRDAQMRERRIREELQHYAEVQVPLQPDLADETIYAAACIAIAERSPFREAAILTRNARGEPKVLCHSALLTANVQGIEQVTQRYKSGDTDLRLNFKGARAVVVRAHNQKGSRTPGRSLIITLPAQSGKAQGWLWLASPTQGWSGLTHDDLLPLESFASRLAISMDNRELTRLLIRTDKLAGLGRLAGGVAHELNNPLTVVCGYTEIIHETTLEPSTRKQTATIMAEALRMKRIIQDLNRFSQPPTAEFGTIDIVEVLHEVGHTLQTDLVRRGVAFELHAAAQPAVVYGCRDSLQQIFFQIVQNSAEAIDRGSHTRDPRVRVDVEQKDGKVRVLVADNGPGFAEPARIFDPFYTTKEPGEGPGLGLSVCYSLVQEHRGEITAYNLQPHGAAVSVTLPVAPAEVLAMPNPTRLARVPVASVPQGRSARTTVESFQ